MNATKHYDTPVLASRGDVTERTENDIQITTVVEPGALLWYRVGEL